MALLKLLRGLSQNLDEVPINDGNLIVTTDTQKIYTDVNIDDNIKRIAVGGNGLDASYDDEEEALVFTK